MSRFIPLPTPDEMNRWDRSAMDEFGIIPEMLMENASREALHVLQKKTGPVCGKRILFFMGPGNNGGDAACLARHCHDNGALVQVLHTRLREEYRNEAGYHFRLAARTGVFFRKLVASTLAKLGEEWQRPHIIVDGLLGTGLSDTLRTEIQEYVSWINAHKEYAHIFSLDCPTGLCGQSGEPKPLAVTAHTTITFEEAKLGLVMPSSSPYTGELIIRRIGIPEMVKEKHPATHEYMDHATARSLLPENSNDMHKGTAGRVLVIGGSEGMTGAPHLAALGAQRGGAGYVTLAAPAGLIPAITGNRPEFLTVPLGSSHKQSSNEQTAHTPSRHWDTATFAELEPFIGQADALVVGPGLGRSVGAGAFLEWLFAMKRPTTVFDADALFWLAKRPELFEYCQESDILTPHPAEAARLLGTETAHIQSNRSEAVHALSLRTQAVVVLKGAATIIAKHDEMSETPRSLVLSPFATPTLAVAGSGDVLAGLIASHAARNIPPRQAACIAVYEHGLAGTILQQQFTGRGNTPQEIAHTIPNARKELLTC